MYHLGKMGLVDLIDINKDMDVTRKTHTKTIKQFDNIKQIIRKLREELKRYKLETKPLEDPKLFESVIKSFTHQESNAISIAHEIEQDLMKDQKYVVDQAKLIES